MRVAALVHRDGTEVPWWRIVYRGGSGGLSQIYGELEGVEVAAVPPAMTVSVPPVEPVAVRVDFADEGVSRLFVVVAAPDAPLDGEDAEGNEFTGVRDPRTDSELWVWSSMTSGRDGDRYSVLSGEVPEDLEQVLLVGARSIVAPVTEKGTAARSGDRWGV